MPCCYAQLTSRVTTVDREIFAVKIFSSVRGVTKIKREKFKYAYTLRCRTVERRNIF